MADSHPLDPLTGEEMRRAARLALANRGQPSDLRVVDVSLHEPDKAQVRAWTAGTVVGRRAWVVLLHRRSGATIELAISLDDDLIVSERELRAVQPAITLAEYEECVRVVGTDSRFQEGLRRRGVTAFDLVTIEARSPSRDRSDERPIERIGIFPPARVSALSRAPLGARD